ncbi:TlpA family protein disulfide reductase [uncultured Sphingomonas sp.]|uniref:TlpA family protein disulfide reductase n=1 Tax=uncultured Sphingomonas sp. TaxID=158754 RepID=UPI0035C9F5ED
MMAAVAAVPSDAPRPLTPGEPPLAGPAVVVLWASWCAACKAELARLPQLATAAAPLPVKTLALDSPDRALALLRQRGQPTANAYADDRPPRTVLDQWGGPGTALPIAVALDAQGRICGRKLGLLGTDQLHDWAARCSK